LPKGLSERPFRETLSDQSGEARHNPSLRREKQLAAPAANQQQKIPHWGFGPLFYLFYQAEIMHRQLPQRQSYLLAGSNGRENMMRLWQLHGCRRRRSCAPARAPCNAAPYSWLCDEGYIWYEGGTASGSTAGSRSGKIAASQKDWPVAIDYFDQARRSAPSEALPLYYLGLAETQIRGRELRAICWLEAFLALAPKDAEADHVRAVINEMEVRVRSNLNRVRRLLEQLADKTDYEDFRDVELKALDKLRGWPTYLPFRDSGDPEGKYHRAEESGNRPLEARYWVGFADQCMQAPTFVDFDRALNNALDGHSLEGHYEEVNMPEFKFGYPFPIQPPYPTPAQKRHYDDFWSVADVA
jgi:hypothetical protein